MPTLNPDNDDTATRTTENLIPGVDGDQLSQYLEARFGSDQTGLNPPENNTEDNDDEQDDEPSPDDTEEDEESSEEESDDDESSEPPASGSVTLLDGTVVNFTADELTAFHTFQERLRNDDTLRNIVTNWDQVKSQLSSPPPGPGVVPSQPPAPPSPPEELDLDDPAIKYFYEQNQALLKELETLKGVTSTVADQNRAQVESQVNALIERGRVAFRDKYKLSDQDATEILNLAGHTNAALSYMQGIDPRTGQPVPPEHRGDAIQATMIAMEMSMWANDNIRTKVVKDQIAQDRKDRIKKSKLHALSGNSGSAPRTSSQPKNDSERRAAMLDEVRNYMNGEG